MRGLTLKQKQALKLLHRGFVSSHTQGSMSSLIKRGLVVDLGLHDHERKCKRYGADRFRVTPLGRKEIREGRA